MKDWIRTKIINLIGYPSSVQALITALDEMEADFDAVCIYPLGEYCFDTVVRGGESKPMVFPTPQERAAYVAGLNFGVTLMGGTTTIMSKDSLDTYEEMEKLASVRGDPKKVN